MSRETYRLLRHVFYGPSIYWRLITLNLTLHPFLFPHLLVPEVVIYRENFTENGLFRYVTDQVSLVW